MSTLTLTCLQPAAYLLVENRERFGITSLRQDSGALPAGCGQHSAARGTGTVRVRAADAALLLGLEIVMEHLSQPAQLLTPQALTSEAATTRGCSSVNGGGGGCLTRWEGEGD
jgi:hypothetical protein